MKLNELIGRTREAMGLSQEGFAALLHVRARTVYNWEEGLFMPHDSALQRIASVAPLEFRDALVLHLPEHMREWSQALEVPKFWWEVARKEARTTGETAESWLSGALNVGIFITLGPTRAAVKKLAKEMGLDETILSRTIVETGLEKLRSSPPSTRAEKIDTTSQAGRNLHARRTGSKQKPKREAG